MNKEYRKIIKTIYIKDNNITKRYNYYLRLKDKIQFKNIGVRNSNKF